jgi:hypothetical protein
LAKFEDGDGWEEKSADGNINQVLRTHGSHYRS